MNVEVCLDREAYTEKPDRKMIPGIHKRIENSRMDISIHLLATYVGERGQTFCPAIFKGDRKKENFCQMQLFVLDFDNGCPFERIRVKCEQYGLPILFAYRTFSDSKECSKYRVVLAHEIPIIEQWLADMILKMLKFLFPEADKTCFEVSRMFFGGKGLIEVHEECTFSVDRLAYMYQQELYTSDSTNYARNIKRIADKYNIAVKQGDVLDIRTYKSGEMEEFAYNPIYTLIELSMNSSKIIFRRKKDLNTTNHQIHMCEKRAEISHITAERIGQICPLTKRFLSGKELNHAEKFLLATNFINIKGMSRVFRSIIKQYYDKGSYEKWCFDLRYMRAMEYNPQGCSDNCPHQDICVHDKNLCLTLTGRKRIRNLELDKKYVTVEKSYEEMEKALRRALVAGGNEIHLIKGQTGLGKSYAYKKLLKNWNQRRSVIVAVPTVTLKNEIAGDLSDVAVEMLSLKELCMPPKLQSRVRELYDRGLYRDAKREIGLYSSGLEDGIEKNRYVKYLNFMDVMGKRDSHVIMTHACLLQMSAEQLSGYEIIIDEDILGTMLRNTCSVSVEDVKKAVSSQKITGTRASELQKVMNLADDSYMKSSVNAIRDYIKQEEQNELNISGNVNGLFAAGAYHLNSGMIEYFIPQKLPMQKLVIMSATLDEDVYRLFFKSREIVVYNTHRAKYSGKLIQYTHYSMSRNKLKSLGETYGSAAEVIEYIKKSVPEWNYGISFKEYDAFLEGGMHFGNAAGIDRYKGKNGIIIGTPHLSENCYKLIACYLGTDVMGPRSRICRRLIQYKGYEFNMMTYEAEDLRKIQLYMISSEMEQCIGRSRLLREDAVICLFSDFPCEQAELIDEDYLETLKTVRCTGQGASEDID